MIVKTDLDLADDLELFTNRKVLSQGVLTLTNQMIWPMKKFSQTNKRTGQKLHAPDLSMLGHKNIPFNIHKPVSMDYYLKFGASNMKGYCLT